MLVRRRSWKYLRSTRSMKADRDCFDPARRSTLAKRSFDSVIEVFSFILPPLLFSSARGARIARSRRRQPQQCRRFRTYGHPKGAVVLSFGLAKGRHMSPEKSDVLQGTLDLMVMKTLEAMALCRLRHRAPYRADQQGSAAPQ